MRSSAKKTVSMQDILPLNREKILQVKPSIIIMTSSLLMGSNASEVVASQCAGGRAGSLSHTDSSAVGDSMNQLLGTKTQKRASAPTVITEHFPSLYVSASISVF